jgi:hypothetical protein
LGKGDFSLLGGEVGTEFPGKKIKIHQLRQDLCLLDEVLWMGTELRKYTVTVNLMPFKHDYSNVSFEAFTVVMFQVKVFWVAILCCVVVGEFQRIMLPSIFRVKWK